MSTTEIKNRFVPDSENTKNIRRPTKTFKLEMTQIINNSNRLASDEGFKDKTLLVTGATGFVGTVFVEKVLRSCPLVQRIYVVVKTKRGSDPQTRMKDVFNSPFFDLLKKARGEEILKKVVVISGNVLEPDLGLSEVDRRMLTEEVELIFHIAASVRFNESFKTAVLLNTRGTKLMLELAKKCRKLLMFGHVSTAYCHPEEKILYEKVYPPPADAREIIKIVELLNEDAASLIATKLKGDSPNIYTFTKALAEDLVNDEMNNLPVIILRPSVVVPIWNEPLPGWTNNLHGPVGLMIASGKGIARTVYCNPDVFADFIAVDTVANAIMMAAYDYMTNGTRRVYNLTTSSEIQVTWKQMAERWHELLYEMPFNWPLWLPHCTLGSSKLLHNIYAVFFHYLPAIILDALLFVTGNRPVLWKVQQKLAQGLNLFEYYTCNQWHFKNDNILQCRSNQNETESKIYDFNIASVNVDEYIYNCLHAARLYLLKEGDETLPTARRYVKILWAVDRLCKILMLAGFGYLLMKHFVWPALDIQH